MVCCSNQCERRHLCAHYIDNLKQTDGWDTVEDYYWYGSASISSKGCEEHWHCGPQGNWGKFAPINEESLDMPRYIDANKLIKHLKDEYKECTSPNDDRQREIAYGVMLGLKMAMSYVKTLSTADVVPRDEVAKIFEAIDRFIELYNTEAYYSIGELTYDVNILKEEYAKGGKGND